MNVKELMEYIPLLNILLIFFFIPLFRLVKENNELKRTQERRIQAIEQSLEYLKQETSILVMVVLKRMDGEAMKEYIALTHKIKHHTNSEKG